MLKEIIKPSGYRLHQKVDEQFRIKQVWDAYGIIKEYEYAENYFAVISLLGKMETYFDEHKRISHQTDCNGNITRFRYGQGGQLESIEDPEGFLHEVE